MITAVSTHYVAICVMQRMMKGLVTEQLTSTFVSFLKAMIILEASKEEQRCVVYFLSAESIEGREIYRRMEKIYRENCKSLSKLKEWSKRFREEHVSRGDDAFCTF